MAELGGRFITLTTYRKSGQPVPTPMWFVAEGQRVWLWTRVDSGKVRRLRNNAAVIIASSDAKGHLTGPVLRGRAQVLGAAVPVAKRGFREKYGVVTTIWRAGSALARRLGRGHEWSYLEIELEPDGSEEHE